MRSRREDGYQILRSMLGLAHDARGGHATLFMTTLREGLNLQPYVFCDESGKWQDKDFICLCGYLSTDHDWSVFTGRWGLLLEKHGFTSMHLTTYWQECRKRQWSDETSDAILHEFIDAIRDHIWLAFAVGMDVRAFKALPSHVRSALGAPDILCLHRLLRLARNRFARENYDGRISLIFDEDVEYVVKTYRIIYRLRRAHADLGRYIGAVSFADDTFLLPLQAADLLANLTSRFYRLRLVDKDTPISPLLERLLTHPQHTQYGLDREEEFWNAETLSQNWRDLVKEKL
jgi:hypothetical protein